MLTVTKKSNYNIFIMMDQKSQEEFDRITSIPELELLTPEDIAFLKARRAYLTPSQRMGYSSLNLFDKGEKQQKVEMHVPNANALSQEELSELKEQK